MREQTIEIECKACIGTGLYCGIAERNGSAVICQQCDGTGRQEFKYKPFAGRNRRQNVNRVFKSSFGYVHSAEDANGIKFSDGGVAYNDWLNGDVPKPVKSLYCPFLWTWQQLKRESKLYSTRCENGTGLGCRISECKHWADKSQCWEIYEAENGA